MSFQKGTPMRSLLPLIFVLAATGIYGQEVRTERKTVAVPTTEVMPTVGFSFTSELRSRLHLPEGPVKIMGFGDGMFASEVEVQNDSQKQVKSIQLDWYLFASQTSMKETKR